MLKTYGTKDLSAGDILITKAGKKYIVMIGENGDKISWFVVAGNGDDQIAGLSNSFMFDDDGNMVIKGKARDNGNVVEVKRFNCEPVSNRVSEALKMLTGRNPSYNLKTIWKADNKDLEKDMETIIKEANLKGYTIDEMIDYLRKI